MANTTFTGPVRSQNGFQSVSINSTTGAVTVDASFGTATSVTTLAATTVTATNLVDTLPSTYLQSGYTCSTFFGDGFTWWGGWLVGSINAVVNLGPRGSTATISSVVSSIINSSEYLINLL